MSLVRVQIILITVLIITSTKDNVGILPQVIWDNGFKPAKNSLNCGQDSSFRVKEIVIAG